MIRQNPPFIYFHLWGFDFSAKSLSIFPPEEIPRWLLMNNQNVCVSDVNSWGKINAFGRCFNIKLNLGMTVDERGSRDDEKKAPPAFGANLRHQWRAWKGYDMFLQHGTPLQADFNHDHDRFVFIQWSNGNVRARGILNISRPRWSSYWSIYWLRGVQKAVRF